MNGKKVDRQMVAILVTAPSKEIARAIAKALLERKLAACVNILPGVTSLYTWEGAIEDDEEFLLIIKSRVDLVNDRIIPAVKEIHPYQIPEIIALPIIAGHAPYLEWISEVTK